MPAFGQERAPLLLSVVSIRNKANFPFYQPCLILDFRAASSWIPFYNNWTPKSSWWVAELLFVPNKVLYPSDQPYHLYLKSCLPAFRSMELRLLPAPTNSDELA